MESDPDDRTLYVANLDKLVTEEILYELFLQAGPIERVSIPVCNDSYRYGFVTYKHLCSLEYAIELFKGTNLYKKELLIKKKGARSNNNGQQSSDSNKYNSGEAAQARLTSGFSDLNPNFQQIFQQNMNCNPESLVNFTSISLKEKWPNWNKPYNYASRNHSSRPREIRDRRKNRDYGSKLYHSRKNRRRD